MENIRLVSYMRQYVASTPRGQDYKSRLRRCANKLECFEKFIGRNLFIKDFNYRMMEEYDYFLRNDKKKYLRGTIKQYGDKTKEFLGKAGMEGFYIDASYKEYKFSKAEVVKVALTESEIEKIFNQKNLSKPQEITRFWFLFTCCTGLRYSDITRIESVNFCNDNIQIKTQKSNNDVIVPKHWIVVELMKRFKGELPLLRTQQNFNKIIKRICRKANIDKKILVERHEGVKFVKKTFEKWRLVTHHTGRHTFATNAYLAGIPLARIMLLTGHKTEQAFFEYINIDKEENAKLLSEHAFFKGDSVPSR